MRKYLNFKQYLRSEMKLVGVDLKKVKVDSFSVVNSSVVLELFFNDGFDKEIFRTAQVADAKKLAEDIIREIVRMEKNINVKFDGERVSGESRVVVRDEGEKVKGLAKFLEEINAKMQRVKTKRISDGYLDLLREIKNMEAVL
jgi:hypothetical protein